MMSLVNWSLLEGHHNLMIFSTNQVSNRASWNLLFSKQNIAKIAFCLANLSDNYCTTHVPMISFTVLLCVVGEEAGTPCSSLSSSMAEGQRRRLVGDN
jgi:hypothetical protein